MKHFSFKEPLFLESKLNGLTLDHLLRCARRMCQKCKSFAITDVMKARGFSKRVYVSTCFCFKSHFAGRRLEVK